MSLKRSCSTRRKATAEREIDDDLRDEMLTYVKRLQRMDSFVDPADLPFN